MTIRLKRAYEEPEPEDGFRVLVDRLWPRGVGKEEIALDRWMKEIAPSDDLRRWYDHDPERWEEFRERYETEIDGMDEEVAFLNEKSEEGTLTLVYAAKDRDHNNAVVLRDYLAEPS